MSQLEPCPYVRYGVEHWLSIPCSSEGEYTVASSNVGAYSLVKNSLFVTGYQALFGEPKLLPAGIAGGCCMKVPLSISRQFTAQLSLQTKISPLL